LVVFAAPLDSLWSVAAHDKLENSHSQLFSQSGRLGGKSTGVLLGPVRLSRLFRMYPPIFFPTNFQLAVETA
jgi:hypothetical protein